MSQISPILNYFFGGLSIQDMAKPDSNDAAP